MPSATLCVSVARFAAGNSRDAERPAACSHAERGNKSAFLEDLIELDTSFCDLVEQARADIRDGRVSSIESVRERLLRSHD